MITITVNTEAQAQRAEAVMQEQARTNANIANANYEITTGDFPSIDGIDEIEGTKLYHKIFNAEERWDA
jgi:hypothetical protein